MEVDGKPTFILMKESDGEYYEVDQVTNTIWHLLDGRRTVKEICDEAKKSDESITDREVRDVIVSLAEEGTIESTEPEIERRRVEVVSAYQLDVRVLKDSSKSLASLFRITRKLARKGELQLAIGISLLGVALFYETFLRILSNATILEVAGSALLGFFLYQLVVLLPVYATHELAHAAVCDYYGGKPREIGTGLFYLAPFFYCDTTDSWRLPRRARLMISVAGPLSTIVIASLLVVWSYFVPAGYGRDVLQIGAFLSYYGSLLNFSPVIETDGYYILSDLLNIPNLRDESFGYLKRLFLRGLGRHIPAVRQGKRLRRILLLYAVISVVWLAAWGYTTSRLMVIYGMDAYQALLSLSLTVLRIEAFNATSVIVDFATLAYFGLLMAGFAVMGIVGYRRMRIKGVKLETIHDKRVSVFLPIPSFIPRPRASALVEEAKGVARKFSRSFSVTSEPPLCVAVLRLGRVDESLDATRKDMSRIEESFRSLHNKFLYKNLNSAETTAGRKKIASMLVGLANRFPPFERRRAVSAVAEFLHRRDSLSRYLLESAFGTVWTLELSPADYKRLGREIFPALIAEDLGVTDLPGELEDFKKRTVIAPDAIAQLSSEIEEEVGQVRRKPEVYQVTAFLEPVKSRLVFAGRTEKVEGSVVWLGALFLYQAWIGYVSEVLADAALGLRSTTLATSPSFTKAQVAKLSDSELASLKEEFDRMDRVREMVGVAESKVGSTYESALNFHETLGYLVNDEAFDIGLYKPILNANARRLEIVKDRIEKFRGEFERVSKKLGSDAVIVAEEGTRRASGPTQSKQGWSNRLLGVFPSIFNKGALDSRPPAYEAEIKLMFATTRLVYDVVACSDIAM